MHASADKATKMPYSIYKQVNVRSRFTSYLNDNILFGYLKISEKIRHKILHSPL